MKNALPQVKDLIRMNISLKRDIFKPFWAQLFRNIGYSEHYQRYVIVEPLCYLVEEKQSIIQCVPVDPIVYPQVEYLGSCIASFIDREWDDCLEQVLHLSKKYKIILLTDEELIFQKQRLPEMLVYLKNNQEIAKKIIGLVHYHFDEPSLSNGDIDAINWFTNELKSIGGKDQIGLVVSERDPSDTLEIIKLGEKTFENHLMAELFNGKIELVGKLFSGKERECFPIEIRLVS
jgi:hypothetical protein